MNRTFPAVLASVILPVFLLAACAAPAPAPTPAEPEPPSPPPAEAAPFVFTRDNFPRLNGSTAMVPLGQAIASVLLGESREEVSDLIRFSRTTQSYRELMNGQAGLLISGAPPEGIYAEKEESGSQTAMRKLVMGDLPLMTPPAEYVSGAMGDLVEVIASYSDSAAAIGYTVYYYAHDMKMANGLKLLAVDGVQPSAETIRSREYPFINDSYVVIPAGLPEDDPAKILYDWIMSEEGQRLVAHEGCVSTLDVGDAP